MILIENRGGKVKLSQLPVGETAKVMEVLARDNQQRRLLDLGLTVGTEVKVEKRSPLGDPTAFLIRGTIIALRSEETELIKVTKI